MAERRYIGSTADGWLRVKPEPSGEIVSLPEYLQVEFSSTSNGRDYFTVLEGINLGKKFSVLTGNLKSGAPGYRAPAHLRYNLSLNLLTYQGGQVKAITHPRNPIAIGLHPVQIPDHPHDGGIGYLAQSSYAKVWFYLGVGHAVRNSNDRYLHTGERTAGCVTVDPSQWTKLYQYLILCRSGDGKTVGTLSVAR
jgi:hypothetical protein